MNDKMNDYRMELLRLQQKSQDDFDKTVLSLSGGALGVTFAFINDIIGENPVVCSILIFLAWISWGLSISAILFSFFTSSNAMRETISKIDNNLDQRKNSGGLLDKFTGILNLLAGILFFVGIVLAAIFIRMNF